jgi:dienelactone hydrolase
MLAGMHAESVSYTVADVTMIGHLAYDEAATGPRPTVLLCHEGPGLDDHVKGRAERLAGLGYTAFALDCYGGGVPLPIDEAMDKLVALMGDADTFRALGYAGLDVLLSQPQADRRRVAVIGYCMGGALALELARSGADVQAVVGFHPSLDTVRPEDAKNITASVLVCCGTEDPFISLDQRLAFEREMHDGGVADWNIEVYGDVGHSFTNAAFNGLGIPGIAYDERADRRSWQSMLELFDEKLGPLVV